MNWRIAPPLVEEASCSIQIGKIFFIRLTPPELHVGNLKIAPKMTRTVPMRFHIVLRPDIVVDQPRHRIIRMQVFGMSCEELNRRRP